MHSPWGLSACKNLIKASLGDKAGLYFEGRISIATQRSNATSVLGALPDAAESVNFYHACGYLS